MRWPMDGSVMWGETLLAGELEYLFNMVETAPCGHVNTPLSREKEPPSLRGLLPRAPH